MEIRSSCFKLIKCRIFLMFFCQTQFPKFGPAVNLVRFKLRFLFLLFSLPFELLIWIMNTGFNYKNIHCTLYIILSISNQLNILINSHTLVISYKLQVTSNLFQIGKLVPKLGLTVKTKRLMLPFKHEGIKWPVHTWKWN